MTQLIAVSEPVMTQAERDDLTMLVRASKAPSTWRAYTDDEQLFRAWCNDQSRDPLPASPQTIALFIRHEAARGMSVSTIGRRLSSLAHMHRQAGHPAPTDDPVVRAVWAGVRRTLGTAPRRVRPLTVDVARRMVATCDRDRIGDVRDAALLLIGLAGALRRSEVSALNVDDVRQVEAGLLVTIRRSKGDQEGAGVDLPIPFGSPATCPVRWLARWLDVAGHVDGALFRSVDRHGNVGGRLSGRSIAAIVKKRAEVIGEDPVDWSGHSMRAGFATSAAQGGADALLIAEHTRHKTLSLVQTYVRRERSFTDGAVAVLGL